MKLIASLLIFFLASFALADLPADAGSGAFLNCSFTASNSTVTCSGDVSLGNNATVNLSQDLTWQIAGDLTLSNGADINPSGSFDLNIEVGGDVTLSQNSSISGNLNVAGDLTGEQNASITGDINVAGDLTGEQNSTWIGNIIVQGNAKFEENSDITGDVVAFGSLDFSKDDNDGTCYGSLGNYITFACAVAAAPIPNTGLCFDFESGTPSNWLAIGAGTNNGTAQSPSNSLYVYGPSGLAISSAFNLSAYTANSVELSLWVSSGFNDAINNPIKSDIPNVGDDFQLEYLNSSNNWIVLKTYAGDEVANNVFTDLFTLSTPSQLHSGFALRFRKIGGDPNQDYWHIDDICLNPVIPPPIIEPDHFSFSHDGNGVNCLAETIILTARQADGTKLDSYVGVVNLSTSTNRGDWFYNDSTAFTSGGPNSGEATVEFLTGDAGQVTLTYANTVAEPLNFNADGSGVTERSGNAPTTPRNDDPIINFAPAGFIFLDSSNSVISELNLIAASITSARVRAVTTDPTSGVCLPLFADASNVTINAGTSCTNPTSCALGEQVLWSNGVTASETLPNPENLEAGLDTKNLSVLFSTNATADFDITATDLGEIDLSLFHELSDGDGTKTGEVIEGALQLNSRPASLRIVNVTNSAGAVIDGTQQPLIPAPATLIDTNDVFTKVDQPFTLNISALDANADVLPSFGRVNDLYDLDWTLTSIAGPTGATMGSLTGDILNKSSADQWQSVDSTGDGNNDSIEFTSTNGLTYDEVGQINLVARITDFLESGFTIVSSPELVGRFVPASLQVMQIDADGDPRLTDNGSGTLIANPAFNPPNWGDNSTAYQGRPDTLDSIQFAITAYGLTGNPVTNYDGDAFNLSLPNAINSFDKQTADVDKGGNLQSSTTWSLSDNNNFNGSVTLNATNPLVIWPRNPAGVTVNDALSIITGLELSSTTFTDSDGICNQLSGAGCESVPVDIADNTLYYARLSTIDQVDASSREAYVPLTLEHLSAFNDITGEQIFSLQNLESDIGRAIIAGLDFVTGGSCSIAGCNAAGTTVANSADGTLTDVNGNGATLIGGLGQLRASSSVDINGVVEVELEIPSWLYWDWDNTGNVVNDRADSTYLLFGSYQGRSPILFTRPGYR